MLGSADLRICEGVKIQIAPSLLPPPAIDILAIYPTGTVEDCPRTIPYSI